MAGVSRLNVVPAMRAMSRSGRSITPISQLTPMDWARAFV
jgi:hypothetical protein